MIDVVTIGETMAVLTPETTGYMRHATRFNRKFGGAESNFAIGLSRLGHREGWISRVGDDEFGKAMLAFIRGEGVDISHIRVHPEAPTGILFKEFRRTDEIRVYYYRQQSAASQMTKDDLNESYIKQAKYLFLTGITPALSPACHEMVLEALRMAKKNKVTVVFDPNIRKKLWREERAESALKSILTQVDIVLPGIRECAFLFGKDDLKNYGQSFLDFGAEIVVVKLGSHGAHYFTTQENRHIAGIPVSKVIDPVGAGDGFAAGFVSGLLDGLDLTDAVKRGNTVGAMATTMDGDVEGLPDREDLQRFIQHTDEDVIR